MFVTKQEKLIGVLIMPELSTVEYDYNFQQYVAILTNGDKIALEATNLGAAEQEAYLYLMQNEFTSFSGSVSWN